MPNEDGLSRIRYAYEGENTSTAKEQIKLLDDLGYEWVNTETDYGDRSFLDELMSSKFNIRKDDCIVIACEAYIGDKPADRRKALKRITELNAYIEVAGEDPVYYDTEEKIELFLRRARDVAWRDNGLKQAGNLRINPGRKSIIELTEEQDSMVRFLWKWRGPNGENCPLSCITASENLVLSASVR